MTNKAKVGKLYRKRIVTGDKNLVADNEIHLDDLKSNEGGGSSNIEYLDLSNITSNTEQGVPISSYISVVGTEMVLEHPVSKKLILVNLFFLMGSYTEDALLNLSFKAVKIDFNSIYYRTQGRNWTIKEGLLTAGITQEQLDAIPRITEEEFYALVPTT